MILRKTAEPLLERSNGRFPVTAVAGKVEGAAATWRPKRLSGKKLLLFLEEISQNDQV